MTHLEVELSIRAFAAFLRVLRAQGVEPFDVTDGSARRSDEQVARTARPGESVVLRYAPQILRRLLERALADLPGDEPEAVELSALLRALRERRDVGTCVLLAR